MSKLNLVCTKSKFYVSFTAGKLYRGKVDKYGAMMVKDNHGTWQCLDSHFHAHAEDGNDGSALEANFVSIKTKTIKCMSVDHKAACMKTFKVGKRYQVHNIRPVGIIAGTIFDEDGDSWNLYRDDVGFKVGGDIYSFEAKYS